MTGSADINNSKVRMQAIAARSLLVKAASSDLNPVGHGMCSINHEIAARADPATDPLQAGSDRPDYSTTIVRSGVAAAVPRFQQGKMMGLGQCVPSSSATGSALAPSSSSLSVPLVVQGPPAASHLISVAAEANSQSSLADIDGHTRLATSSTSITSYNPNIRAAQPHQAISRTTGSTFQASGVEEKQGNSQMAELLRSTGHDSWRRRAPVSSLAGSSRPTKSLLSSSSSSSGHQEEDGLTHLSLDSVLAFASS
jgi:hypothetical protein